MLDNFKVILWDFDGVLMNSNSVRDIGFEKVLADYPVEQVEALMQYHKANGGLSRYVKFRYFFEEVRNEKVSNQQIQDLATKFSIIMQQILFDQSLLIKDSIQFVKDNSSKFRMHIVSGSDGVELNSLCKFLKIDQYFISIEGSPVAKNKLVNQLLLTFNYAVDDCVLIGDSINDLEAAEINKIAFRGYNNSNFLSLGIVTIKSFYQLNNNK